MPSYFKINFAEPGKNVSREPHKEKIQRLFQKRMGISVSLLVILFVCMIFGGIFYFNAIYLPMEKKLTLSQQKLKQLEVDYKVKSGLRHQRATKAKEALKVIDELKTIKAKDFNWSNRLKVLNRTLVKNLWLSSMDVQEIKPPPPPPRARGGGKHKRKPKPKVEVKSGPTKYKITIRGATYADPDKKPLKKISKFMTKLIDEPYWGDYFFLKDWTIDSTESVINFEVILESRTL